MKIISQNAPCPCGSGKKYKRCCGLVVRPSQPSEDSIKRVQAAMQAFAANEFKRARMLLNQVLKFHPEDSGLLGIKGMTYYGEHLYQDALKIIEYAISLNKNDSRLFNFLGQVQVARNHYISAEQAFGRAVTLDPGFVEAWYNLGTTQFQTHRPARAIKTFLYLHRIRPEDAELSMQLVRAYYSESSMDLCAEYLNEAKRLGMDVVQTELWHSAILRTKGDVNASVAIETGHQLQYGHNDVYYLTLLDIARVDAHVGHLESAEYWLEKGIEIRPDIVGAYSELAGIRKFKAHDQAIVDRMSNLLVNCPVDARRGLEFALGKVFADIGEFDFSFAHYKNANDIVHRVVSFDAKAYIKEIDAIVNATSLEYLEQLPAGSDSDLPIIIIGTPRSGTTLTEQIISCHSLVGAAGELDIWPRLVPSLYKDYTIGAAENIAQICLDIMSEQSPGFGRVTDKLPVNYTNIGMINAVFPNAKIIHVQRHPIDACLSIYFQNFNDDHDYKWDLENLAVWYEQYQRLMKHWREVLPPGTFFEFKYEDLVDDTEGVSRKIMEFLGLEWEPRQLDFYKQDRAVFTASKWQARQPVYKSSKERWRKYEKHLGPLLSLLKYA